MRCHAVVMASAHGQDAWIFRWRRRPPRTSRAAACSTRTQRPGLGPGPGQVAVQSQQFQPGEQDLPGHRGGQQAALTPCGVPDCSLSREMPGQRGGADDRSHRRRRCQRPGAGLDGQTNRSADQDAVDRG